MSSRSTLAVARALSGSAPRANSSALCAICAHRTSTLTPHSSPRRNVHSTPSSSGVSKWLSLSRSTPTPTTSTTITDARAEFLQALSSNHINALQKSYETLLAQHLQIKSLNPNNIDKADQPLQRGELMNAMIFLSGRSEITALSLLKKIYTELDQWGIERLPKHSRAVLRGICGVGRITEAIQWVDIGGGDIEDWRIVLKGAVRHNRDFVPIVEAKLKEAAERDGKLLSAGDYTLLLRHLRLISGDDKETRSRLRELLAETKEKGIHIMSEGEVELVLIHLQIGDIGRAGKLVDSWILGKDPILWNTTLDYRMARNELKGVEMGLEKMKELGIQPYGKAIGYLAVRSLEKDRSDIWGIVDEVEGKYGEKIGGTAWSSILEMVPKLDERLSLYEEIKSRGIPIDSHIANSLITRLCSLNPPNLRTSLDIYADLTSRNHVISTSSVRNRLLAIYSTLFRAYSDLSKSADPSIPITLLKDMRRYGLSIPTPILTSLIVSLIRSSPDHYAAFNNYAHLYALNPSMIDGKAYSVIISTFISHSTPSSPFSPPNYVMEMIKDMRKSGYPPSPQLLTTLLSNYGSQAVKSRKSSSDPVYRQTKLDGLHKAISEIHNTLKLENIITPDIPLYNALMEAYAHIGAYSAAFEVWDLLVERRPHVPKSEAKEAYGPGISVVLDACGRAGQLVRARRIWGWVKKHHLVDLEPGGKLWEGWVECLCRTGQFEEAVDIVLQKENPEMLRILLKFSWMDKGIYGKLPELVRSKYPDMWSQVGKKYKKGLGRKEGWDGEEDL